MYQSEERQRDRGYLGEENGGHNFPNRRAGLVYTGPVLCYNVPNHTENNFMSKQLDQQLMAKIRNGSVTAKNELLQKYERLCHKLAFKFGFTASNHDHEDLVQEGRIGLLKAIESFDENQGASFMTWAYYHVRGSIVSAGRADRRQPKYPHSIEDCPRAYNIEDPTQDVIVKDDLPRDIVRKIIEECCGGLHTKRAKIVMDRYGLLGHKELRNCECAQKYGITKYAVTSHTSSFKRKARLHFPELAQFV